MNAKRFFFTLLILIIVTGIGFVPTYTFIMKLIYPLSHSEEIYKYSSEYSLNPYIVMGVIRAESNFIPDAKSPKSAKGLMQITDSTAEWIAQKMDISDFNSEQLYKMPGLNIKMGCWYLRYLLDKYNNNLDLALCSYNAGQGNVDKWLSDLRYSTDGKNLDKIPFPETKNYVLRVNKYSKEYRKLYK